MTNRHRAFRIQIHGIVQGVGFRPFIYNLAHELNLTGWVNNNASGVEIEICGEKESIESFLKNIRQRAPNLARISDIQVIPTIINGYTTFTIIDSVPGKGDFVPVTPDIGVCSDCLREFHDPNDRRYHYPFINCTNCGPRYTIIRDTPYDRPSTTMSAFVMCIECATEYNNPSDRRFHAQPIACPSCGPKIWVEYSQDKSQYNENASNDQVLGAVQTALHNGKIVAIKGLGGFHLACNAIDSSSVNLLRHRKKREHKPFALMLPDIQSIAEHCFLSEDEVGILQSPEKPIVILKKRLDSTIADEVAPGQGTVGVMLPYTPLHHLLFTKILGPNGLTPINCLVMTSGNTSDEPIIYENQTARKSLEEIADIFLMNDRPIFSRCDDSLVRTISIGQKKNQQLTLRRARGFAPAPHQLSWKSLPILGVGAELKNTICLTKNDFAVTSSYIGDLQNYETYNAFEMTISHFEHLFKINPQLLVCDLHPDYLSTRYALERSQRTGVKLIQVQHHHAHIASVMAEHRIPVGESVIGLAFDGTGYGDDGNIWGGEGFLTSYQSSERTFHLGYFPLPGGDLAVHYPARTALGLLWANDIDWFPELPCTNFFCADDLMKIKFQLSHKINSPLTSSMGRLFDAVASLLNIRQIVNYEAQAAIELEAICQTSINNHYEIQLTDDKIDVKPMLLSIVDDIQNGIPSPIISAKFHNAMIQLAVQLVHRMNASTGIRTVALSGGVWQNMVLLEGVIKALMGEQFTILVNQNFPTNDGGISLGQVVVAQQVHGTG